ncbi:hypothetical protein Bpfe_020036 [Biomphalaria pfeifferi]|uniref:Uncharacterized protein n=1 Tax=Biomphalaria pfeifferi TaxID=112525 RepID=A0AAD8F4L8_BIOPF|nr:hypothetical protein Bpfe_020036 [Biomphalaria pfeifferi]
MGEVAHYHILSPDPRLPRYASDNHSLFTRLSYTGLASVPEVPDALSVTLAKNTVIKPLQLRFPPLD